VSMKINLIWAEAHNHVIGKGGVMPWHIPEDLKHFKQTTLGYPVIMGRKTWESLPPRFRPLPGRTNIVISRQDNFLGDFLAGHASSDLRVVSSLQAALDITSSNDEVWIIGGAQIYAQALPLASVVVITEIDATFEGDAFAPKLNSDWQAVQADDVNSEWQTSASSGLRYRFMVFKRK
jgi:dihydrofolate reductase